MSFQLEGTGIRITSPVCMDMYICTHLILCDAHLKIQQPTGRFKSTCECYANVSFCTLSVGLHWSVHVRTVASGLLYHFSSKPALLSAEKSALNCHIPSSSFTSLLSDSRGYSRARVSSRHSVNAKRRAEKRRKTDMSCMHCLASKGSEVILCSHMFADSAVCAVR